MSGKVKLQITEGTMRGRQFLFEEHDTFLFGREQDCHVCLPDDSLVSRHHFIMEANPPQARIRDLGSLNGTHINDVKYGGRKREETPEEGAMHKYPEVDLKNGDKIRVGDSVITVSLEASAACCECGCTVADEDREKCAWVGGTFICVKCKTKLVAAGEQKKAPKPVCCQKCGKEAAAEAGNGQRGDYICEACRHNAKEDPVNILMAILRQAKKSPAGDKAPAIEGYEIEKRLGIGGFGAVYLARDEKTGKRVAIKVMLANIAVDEKSRKMFLREMDSMKTFSHENIVPLLAHGSAGSAFYFIMDYYPGGSVQDLMKAGGGKIPLSQAKTIMLQALGGLAYIHSEDFVHRDLKPDNILLTGSAGAGSVKISDLGLAKNFQKAGYSGMTVTGAAAGTPPFMPREQVINFKRVKPVSDVWSIGATFYNMLTGQYPRDFPRGKDPIEIILRGNVVPICKRDPSIPGKVAEVIDRALVDNLKNRYQTAAEMLKSLQEVL